MESGFVAMDSCNIYFETHGEGPAVLFIHAGVADSRMWREQLGLDGYRTIAFDQRGFGKTKWMPGPYANRDDALAVLDHLGVDKAVVVGCSNGGETALQLAVVAPERIAGLVLVGAAPRGWEPEGGWAEDPLWDEAVAAFEAGDIDTVVDLDAKIWLAGRARSLDDVRPELLTLFREMDRNPQATESERNDNVQTLEPPTNQQLGNITAPTLVIVGEQDHADLVEATRYLANRLSDHDAVVLPDTAHLPSLDAPEAFNAALTRFLTTLK